MKALLAARRWLALLLTLALGLAGVAYMGTRAYQDAPPLPDFVSESGEIVVPRALVLEGQGVFLRKALMNYGSMFGDGANRGPDFTADALHHVALAMQDAASARLARERGGPATALEQDGLRARVQREIKRNRHDPATNRVVLSPDQIAAARALVPHYEALFKGSGPHRFQPAGYVSDPAEIRALSAFFFWGAWVCGAERPGQSASYTHNWPYDALAGNLPSSAVTLWSVLGLLGLAAGIAVVLFARGRMGAETGFGPDADAPPPLKRAAVEAFVPTPGQAASYKFFAVAMTLFGLQILAGVLTVHDFLGFTRFFGVDLAAWIPITIARSWHLQWALLWILACWIGASVFVLPMLTGHEPPGQKRWIDALFWLLILTTAGSAVGVYLGPMGLLGRWWHALGNQGWEFVELGRLWQGLLFGALGLWCAVLFRGVKPALRGWDPRSLPSWLCYTILAVVLLFTAGFVSRTDTNFVIADFWRWMVVHMWVEAFLEVFTTIIVAAFMVLMGLASMKSATRVVYLSSMLFLGSGILGISHNFYWNAKPLETLALGSVFSTLQVVPLLILALEAWRTRQLPRLAGAADFPQDGAFRFMLGVNFWNVFGAGILGLIINLPIINYYEHGTYLTVNHGHAAFMGVYGNLSLAALTFCVRFLLPGARWNERLMRLAFWSLNVGLMLMVLLDLFPLGVLQFQATLEHGLWHARSLAFVHGEAFQRLTWLRAVGGYLFVFGGVFPLFWFTASRWTARRRTAGSVDRTEPLNRQAS